MMMRKNVKGEQCRSFVFVPTSHQPRNAEVIPLHDLSSATWWKMIVKG